MTRFCGRLVTSLTSQPLETPALARPRASVSQGYAAYVADGYRAPRPNAMPEALYGLICACWHQDPLLRPAMADVAEQLQALQVCGLAC